MNIFGGIIKIQLTSTFALLIVLIALPIFCETGPSISPSIKTFVKQVSGGGTLIQAIPSGNDTYISLSQKGKQDFLLRKTRSTGEKVWERNLHFDIDDAITGDAFRITIEGIAQTSDGGYILAGWVPICPNYYDCGFWREGILVKLASNGSLVWKKLYSSNDLAAVSFTSVGSDSDGGFTAAGCAGNFNRLELFKFTSAGDIVWTKVFTDPQARVYRLEPAFDNGYILILVSRSSNVAHVIKLNNLGTILWKKSLRIEGFEFQPLVSTDHKVVLAFTGDFNRISLVALQTDGSVSWKATYDSSSPSNIWDLMETPDGGYIILTNRSLLGIDSSQKVVFHTELSTSPSFVFNSKDRGILIFGQPFGQNMEISNVDSKAGAGCRTTPLSASRLPQTPLKTGIPKIREIVDTVIWGIKNTRVTSKTTNLPLITICQ